MKKLMVILPLCWLLCLAADKKVAVAAAYGSDQRLLVVLLNPDVLTELPPKALASVKQRLAEKISSVSVKRIYQTQPEHFAAIEFSAELGDFNPIVYQIVQVLQKELPGLAFSYIPATPSTLCEYWVDEKGGDNKVMLHFAPRPRIKPDEAAYWLAYAVTEVLSEENNGIANCSIPENQGNVIVCDKGNEPTAKTYQLIEDAFSKMTGGKLLRVKPPG